MKPIAQHIDEWRIFPRIFMLIYYFYLGKVLFWQITLPEISTQQAAVLSILVGITPAMLAFYVSTGTKWGSNDR